MGTNVRLDAAGAINGDVDDTACVGPNGPVAPVEPVLPPLVPEEVAQAVDDALLVVNPGLGNLTNYFAQDDELIVPSELEEDEEFMARTKYPRDLKKKDE